MENKKTQLGMALGTATHRLRKNIMFNLLKKLSENFCHRCGAEIETPEELSIDHKEDWLNSDDPIGKFFNLENIAFSHLKCNCDYGRSKKTGVKHPSHRAYNEGCRCDECRKVEAEKKRKQRSKKISFKENAEEGKKILEKQGPVTYEEAKAQIERLKVNSKCSLTHRKSASPTKRK